MKSNRAFFILICLYIGCFSAECQSDIQYASNARNLSLGNSGTAISGIESIIYNPSGINSVSDLAISVTGESRFLLSDLTSASLAFVKKLDKFGSFGAVLSNFGIEEYRQQKYGIIYSRLFTESLSIGVEFDYFMTQIDEYGSRGRFGLAGGIQYKHSSKLQIGASARNYLQDLNGESKTINSRIGLSYRPGEKVWVYADLSFLNTKPQAFHGGIEYVISQELVLRLGTQTSPTLMSVGIGYSLNKNVRFDGATSSHQNLGMTPAASFLYESKPK